MSLTNYYSLIISLPLDFIISIIAWLDINFPRFSSSSITPHCSIRSLCFLVLFPSDIFMEQILRLYINTANLMVGFTKKFKRKL